MMRELSLFSGAGGGLLATQHMLGWEIVAYVEHDEYCQRVIAQRIADGVLHSAPIYSDVEAFARVAGELYRGRVDVVRGGFPCQPFSLAGGQLAADDPRNMWPATAEVIRQVRPRYAFLENVPGLLGSGHGYFGHILGDLAELGYNARWGVLSAAAVGAPHLRKRLWLMANTESLRRRQGHQNTGWCGTRKRSAQERVGPTDDGWRQIKSRVCRVVDGLGPRLVMPDADNATDRHGQPVGRGMARSESSNERHKGPGCAAQGARQRTGAVVRRECMADVDR